MKKSTNQPPKKPTAPKGAKNTKSGFDEETGNEKQVIRITEWSADRSKKDIKDWRTALLSAESILMPRRTLITNLYREVQLDPHIIMLMNRFRRDVTGRVFMLKNKKTGAPDMEAVKLLQKKWFYDLLKYKADSKFFGHSLVQIKTIENGEIKEVELVNRKFVIPEKGAYITELGSNDLIDYRNDPQLKPWVFEADNGDFGFLNPAAPYVLFKRNAFVAWSEFCEVFGLPIRYVVTDNLRPSDMNRIRTALINMGKNAYGIFQNGEELKFAETQRTDSYNVFYMLNQAVNAELSKMVLGETMTSEVGTKGSLAQAKVHQGTSEQAAEENRKDVEIWVNEHVLPVLNLQGYGLENVEFAYPKEVVFDPDQWKVYEGLLQRYEIDPQYFIDTYGVPITGERQEIPPVADDNKSEPPTSADKVDTAKKVKEDIENFLKGDFNSIVKLHTALNNLYEEHKH